MANEETWTEGALAVDKFGSSVPPTSLYACRWCAIGHANAVEKDGGDRLEKEYEELYSNSLAEDNDDKGCEYVRNRLIELAQQLEKEN